MPTSPSIKNSSKLLKEFQSKLAASTGITNFDSDSKSAALISSLAKELVDIRNETVSAFESTQITSARKADAISIGETRGVPYRAALPSSVSEGELNLAFYVESGTFGGINGGNNISVPQGTEIFSSSLNNELGTEIIFKTDRDYVLSAADSLAYISATCNTAGTVGNLGQGTIRSHRFSNYVGSGANSLKVVNFYSILNGRNDELLEQYKFRVLQKYNTLHQNSLTKILLAGLEIPGVIDIKSIPGYFGIGTVGVIVYGAEYQSNPVLIEEVQLKLDSFKHPAGKMIAVSGVQTDFDLSLNISTTKVLSREETNRLRVTLRRIILNYFRNLGLGGVFSKINLSLEITNTLPNLLIVQNDSIFTSVLIRNGFSNANKSEQEELIEDSYYLEQDNYAELGTLNVEFV